MDINATLFGQFITFAVFVWFTMRYVWPPIMKILQERRQKIAEGLAAGERGVHDMEVAQHKARELIRDAKIQAANIIEATNKRASLLIEEGKDKARQESDRIIELAKTEIQREQEQAKLELKNQVAGLALSGAEKILGHTIDKDANRDLIAGLITEI